MDQAVRLGMGKLRAGVLAAVPVLLLCGLAAGQATGRRYWVVPVDSLAIGHTTHTHVSVTGRVALVRHEHDGDLHIKLTGQRGFIVAECIPALPCREPTMGERITVQGISREDRAHGWWEVHPVERLTP